MSDAMADKIKDEIKARVAAKNNAMKQALDNAGVVETMNPWFVDLPKVTPMGTVVILSTLVPN